MAKERCTAIVLAAGQGRRMGSDVQKQYMEIEGKPVIYYSLQTFETSEVIDEMILVVGEGQIPYCEEEIVKKYNFHKVKKIVEGGAERYHSVYRGLCAMENEDGFVFVHDGARPLIDEASLERVYEAVKEHHACVVGMPVKDTIKIADSDGFANETPERSRVWMVQTPQVFDTKLIKEAYAKIMERDDIRVTDDAMVVEQMMHMPVKLVKASYENIKITTPEDIDLANTLLRRRS